MHSGTRLSHREILLRILPLDGYETVPVHWLELLAEEERTRSQHFTRAGDRLAYAAAHALLRSTLSQILGCSAPGLSIARDAMGKPFLPRPAARGISDFSLSHTDGLVALAISAEGTVGVDVEAMDRKNMPDRDFEAYGLSAGEIALLSGLPAFEKRRMFFALWTAREAVAKADGRGLSLPLASIRIECSLASACIANSEPAGIRHWRLWHGGPTPRHCLTLAYPEDSRLSVRKEILGLNSPV